MLQLLEKEPKKAIDAFYTDLSFGTAGLRGLMGVGTNRMNRYTVRKTTYGLAQFLLKKKPAGSIKVIIGFDNRHHSPLFAEEAARVLAAQGITAYLFKELRPTPLVSFGCRHLGCDAAIMITASHNPLSYNGYKVYGSDGGQIIPPDDAAITNAIEEVSSPASLPLAPPRHHLIIRVDTSLDTAYLKAIKPLALYAKENKKSGSLLKIVYTSLHGTGSTLVPTALKSWGFSTLSFVESQIMPHPDFPGVSSPNPETKEALAVGMAQMQEEKADLLIATDPDADRVGIATFTKGELYQFSGNEIAILCAHHICKTLSEQKKMPPNGAVVISIVTTDLVEKIATSYGVSCFKVLTGFKWIAEKIEEWKKKKEHTFLFGAEESYGYLIGTHARDKDAVVSSCLLAEIALQAKLQGKSLKEELEEIYRTYGLFREKQRTLSFSPDQKGAAEMHALMQQLRTSAPKVIGEEAVTHTSDLLQKGALPPADVLCFTLGKQSKLIIRPSGTEPKIKLYAFTSEKYSPSAEATCEKRLNAILQGIKV